MKNVNIRDLHHRLLQIKALTDGSYKGHIKVRKDDGSKQYCELLLRLAIDLKDYLYHFEIKAEKELLEESEVLAAQNFVNELLLFFEDFTFLGGKSQQAWIDMTFLFFGIAVYHKASLRLTPKTINLLSLYQTFQKLEKIIYNKMYYNLTDFRY